MSLMGVDVGTTGVKAVVFDEDGRLLSSAYEEYPLLFPEPAASELDSANMVAAALRVIGESASKIRSSDPVQAIGIASQGEAFTPLAANGSYLGNVMTSSDARAQPLVGPWTEAFGRERLYSITGHTAYPIFSLFKMLWLKANRPEVWRDAYRFLFCQDLIAHALTGEARTDFTMAARSMLFDVRSRQWSGEILDSVELDIGRLPEPVPSGTVIGTVNRDTAERLGMGADVRVAVCGHDQPVGALGCGAASSGRAVYSIGTVECITPGIDRLILDPKLMEANLATYPHVLPDLYTTVAFSVTGGSVLRWVRDNLAVKEASEARARGEDPYDAIIGAASATPSDLILLPHFGPTGTPHFDPHGVGTLFGMTLSTSRAEVIRAFLEGITYEMKWNLSILEESGFRFSELRAVGGGAKSDTWMQIKADLLGVPLTRMQVTEATCAGAALLAGQGIGALDATAPSASWAAPVRTFEPQEGFVQAYNERFGIYKDMYRALDAARHQLHNLKGSV